MKNTSKPLQPELINNIFNGSIVLISICLIIITLFQVTDKSTEVVVDEVFSINSVIYFVAVILSYIYMKKPSARVIMFANWFFIAGIICSIISSIFLFIQLSSYA